MKRTGILVITANVAQIAGVSLARAAAGDPFGAAINFLANRGLDAGDFIWVTGTDGFINTTAVMFISEAGPGLPALAALTTAAAPAAPGADVVAAPSRGGNSPSRKAPTGGKKKQQNKKRSPSKGSAKGSAKAGKKTGGE